MPNAPTDPYFRIVQLQQEFLPGQANRPAGDETDEAVGNQPGKVSYRVTV